MGNPLRARRTAAEWAAVSQVIEIADKVGNLPELSAVIASDLAALDADKVPTGWRDAKVTGRLAFGFADAQQQLPSVACRLEATVDLVCQRCLEALRQPLAAEADLLLLDFDEEPRGYDEYDVWELEEPLLRPQDIVDELLVMALPFAAAHAESASCRALTDDGQQDAGEDTTTPFAALREQMARDNEGSG
ncbi:MAG: DUF177 domain-containing protein [Woeseiaceae bacterium]